MKLMCTTCEKGKAIPLQAWTGPEGSRKLRFPIIKFVIPVVFIIKLDWMYVSNSCLRQIHILQSSLRFPDFLTTQDGGKIVSLTYRPPLPPGNTPGTHSC